VYLNFKTAQAVDQRFRLRHATLPKKLLIVWKDNAIMNSAILKVQTLKSKNIEKTVNLDNLSVQCKIALMLAAMTILSLMFCKNMN